jgi:hypothetical protein
VIILKQQSSSKREQKGSKKEKSKPLRRPDPAAAYVGIQDLLEVAAENEAIIRASGKITKKSIQQNQDELRFKLKQADIDLNQPTAQRTEASGGPAGQPREDPQSTSEGPESTREQPSHESGEGRGFNRDTGDDDIPWMQHLDDLGMGRNDRHASVCIRKQTRCFDVKRKGGQRASPQQQEPGSCDD